MTEERIITAATITSGEKTDGKELPKLVQKSKAAGRQIESVIEIWLILKRKYRGSKRR